MSPSRRHANQPAPRPAEDVADVQDENDIPTGSLPNPPRTLDR
ncbi:hypothetical protein T261_4818 [Streptomyces lydicus]|nr:hypothetical protein T261_4818 [Streptomyces lydicus]